MQWIDYAIIGIVVISMLISLIRGFIKEILSLVAWVAAFFVATNFYDTFASLITFTDDTAVRYAVSLFVLFIGTLMIIGFVNYVITMVLKKTGLSGTDRMLGTAFGAVRGVLIVLIAACGLQLAFNYGYFSRMKSEQWYKDAVVLPEVLHVADSTLKSFGLENIGKSMVPGFSSENVLKVEDVPAEAPAEKTDAQDVPVEEEPVK
ncbi:MAG: CvpA family protein [Ruminobacter sp.]|uniref:CvpA family protein n=1 Tax=Ruminobacter sp. TaxID=2774296 RepID=UPI001B769B39|nr:CvpA family protein [Ruminobacter sp.]MBP3748900.1 CvpA family protein [Ruminobacter sp.]